MKKLKEAGFTLIELLAVIVVLGIIALIVFPTVTGSLKGAKEKSYQQQIKMIESSARNWGIENTNSLSETKNSYLTLEALKKSGFIEATIIKDPRTNEEMKGCIVINYDKDYNQYFYEYTEKSCDEVGPVYLANEVKKKVITTGAGVYKISDTEYRYRGGCNLTTGSPYTCIDKDPINNYISISGQKYRIISVDNQGIKVITEKLLETKIPFDKGFVSTTSCTEETCPRNNANNTFCQVASGTYYGCGVYAAVNGNFTVGGKTGTVTQNSFMYDYLNTLGTESEIINLRKNAISVIWNVGAVSSGANRPLTTAKAEEKAITSSFQIGLMNVSDYVQGSLDAACQSDSVSYSLNSQACRNNNWIFYSSNPDGYERMMTLMAHSTSRLWILTGMGFLDGNYGDAAVSWRFRPVGYLSSEISIKAGDGTAANPWIIE